MSVKMPLKLFVFKPHKGTFLIIFLFTFFYIPMTEQKQWEILFTVYFLVHIYIKNI